ncbi:MAG: hypothetical protein MJK11_20815 [Pseudomonadales bacterium]|nr:hypothetical protein [Pseudomonadales bacterium]
MRKFINVNKKDQLILENQFSELLNIANGEPTDNYYFLAVSVFDHWLDYDESMELLHLTNKEECIRRCNLFNDFNKIIIENTSISTFRFKGRYSENTIFKKFTSDSSKYDYMTQKDNGEYCVVLPDIGAIYLEGYDDTNIFYFTDSSVKPIIENWAKDSGLYCLTKK